MPTNRYIVTIEFYMQADDDQSAIDAAEFICEEIRREDDNGAAVKSIHIAPFGALGETIKQIYPYGADNMG